jgi:MerR family transcriptional regulator/heat shock protein HspR
MDDNERALYIISVAAELAGVHPQTLRIYERKGLIEPQRTEGRSRRYSDRDIELLQHIQELTNEGVGLAGVKRILELEAALASAEDEIQRLRSRVREAKREVAETEERVHRTYRRDLVPVRKAVVRVRRS